MRLHIKYLSMTSEVTKLYVEYLSVTSKVAVLHKEYVFGIQGHALFFNNLYAVFMSVSVSVSRSVNAPLNFEGQIYSSLSRLPVKTNFTNVVLVLRYV